MLNMPARFCTSVIQFKTRDNTQSLHTLHLYVVVTFPLPFLFLHTTHSSWPGRPLAVGGTFSGKCLPVRRRGGGAASLRTAECVAVSAERASISSPACPSRPFASSMRKFTCVSFREDCLDSLYKMYAFTMAVSIRWKKLVSTTSQSDD